MHRLLNACIYTWHGLRAAARSEEAFRQEIAVFVLAVPIAFFIASEPWKRLLLIAAVVFVMIVELLNTSIEKLSDHVTPKKNARIKNVKDMGSAAVGLSILLAAAVWLIEIWEWITTMT